ncbi:MAG: hypothetical protein JWQ84_906 [Mucilaginibacter sp.]|nr:hypothetical protein [Mucilaginibacter sp.]MDB5016074.1 hypothetical protein [Mucilaginibacter sp.]
MEDSINVIEIPGLIHNQIIKKITFKSEGLAIEKLRSFDPELNILAENITGFRFGVNPINGYMLTFGWQYLIQIQDAQNKITSIKLNSFYRLRSKVYSKIWAAIIYQLWNNYFIYSYNYYYDLYTIKQEFDLTGIKFHPFGISWEGGSMFWDEIALSNYQTYFMIYHKKELKKTKRCSFKNDWNALILQSLLKRIIQEHNAHRNPVV